MTIIFRRPCFYWLLSKINMDAKNRRIADAPVVSNIRERLGDIAVSVNIAQIFL